MWRTRVLAAVVVVLASVFPACARDEGNTVTIAYAHVSNLNFLPVILADRLGFFAKQGVHVKIDNLRDNGQASTAVLAGQAEAMAGFYESVLEVRAKGKQLESVASLTSSPGMAVMSRPDGDVRTPADFRNRTFGVTYLGGATKHLADYLAIHSGVPVDQVHYTPVAAGPTLVAAFEHHRIDPATTTEPTISTLTKRGLATVAVDLRTPGPAEAALGGPYPGTSLVMRNSWVRSHEATAQKTVNGVYAALQWIRAHSGEQIADVVPTDFYSGVGKEQYARALDGEKEMFNPSGQMSPAGQQNVLRILSTVETRLQGKNMDVPHSHTDQYVQQAARTLNTGG